MIRIWQNDYQGLKRKRTSSSQTPEDTPYKKDVYNLFSRADGIICLAKDWNFLSRSGNTVFITFPLYVERVSVASAYKGSHLLSNHKYAWKVRLGLINDVNFSVLILSTGSKYKDYGELQAIVQSCVVQSFNKLKKVPSLVSLLCRSDSKTFSILPDAFEDFGNIFAQELQHLIDSTQDVPKLDYFFVGSVLGQSMNMVNFLKRADWKYNFSKTTEVLIHFAFDAKLDGQCLFWKRQAVTDMMLGPKPTIEFHPLGIGGVGNFYYNFLSTTKSLNSNSSVSFVKMYSEVFKYVHNYRNQPFRINEVAAFMLSFSCQENMHLKKSELKNQTSQITKFKENCEIMKRCVNEIATCMEKYARLEIITCNRYLENSVETNHSFLSRAATTAIGWWDVEFPELISEQCLVAFSKIEIFERAKENLHPVCNLILRHLTNMTSSINNSVCFEFNIDDFFNVLGAEALGSLMIYGTWGLYDGHGEAHSYKIIKDLGLGKSNIQKSEVTMLPLINCGVTNDSFTYSPTIDKMEFLFKFLIGGVTVSELLTACLTKKYTCISKVLNDMILKSALRVFGSSAKSYYATARYRKWSADVIIKSVSEFWSFIWQLDKIDHGKNTVIYWLINFLRANISTSEIKSVLEGLIESLNMALIQETTYFLFPYMKTGQLILIVPSSFPIVTTTTAVIYQSAYELLFKDAVLECSQYFSSFCNKLFERKFNDIPSMQTLYSDIYRQLKVYGKGTDRPFKFSN